MSYINIGLSTSGSENQAANVPDPLTIGTINAGTTNVTVSNVVSGTVYSLNGYPLASSFSGSRSDVLSWDGQSWGPTKQYLNILSFGAVGDGTTDDGPAFQRAIDNANPGDVIIVPEPSSFYKIVTPFGIWDDNVHGHKRGITIQGPGADIANPTIRAYHVEPAGTAASIFTSSNGGSGTVMMAVNIGTGSLYGVTSATTASLLDFNLAVWNAYDDRNVVELPLSYIDVSDPNNVKLWVINSNGQTTDTNNGQICWRIAQPMITIRGAYNTLKDLHISTATGGTNKYSMIVEINESRRAGAAAVNAVRLENVTLTANAYNNPWCRYGVSIARSLCPESGHGSFAGNNGLGYPQQYNTNGVSELVFKNVSFAYFNEAAVEHVSFSGQSKSVLFDTFTVNYCGAAWVAPAREYTSGSVLNRSLPHANFYHGKVSQIRDYAFNAGNYASDIIRIDDIYTEVGAGIFRGLSNATNSPLVLRDYTHNYYTWLDKSGRGDCFVPPDGNVLQIGSSYGPHIFEGLTMNNAADKGNTHIELGANSTGLQMFSFKNCAFKGTTTQGQVNGGLKRAKLTTGRRGPHKFNGDEKLVIKINGGANITCSFSSTDFSNAIQTWPVDMNRINYLEIGRVITNQLYLSGVVAHGRTDNANLTLYHLSGTGANTLQVVSASWQFGFSSALQTGAGSDPVNLETFGYFDTDRSVSQFTGVLNLENCMAFTGSTGTRVTLPQLSNKRYGSMVGAGGMSWAGPVFAFGTSSYSASSDVFFTVSGSRNVPTGANRKVSLFLGDLMTSGTLEAQSASLTFLNGMTLSASLTGSRSNVLAVNASGLRMRPDKQFNVKDFGAVGDNTSDDISAFEQIIALKEAGGTPVRIYVPNGTYKLSRELNIGTIPFILEGDGYYLHNLITFGNSAWTDGTTVRGSILRWSGATHGFVMSSSNTLAGTRLEELGIVGPGTGNTTGFFNSASGGIVDLAFKNVMIGNWYRGLDLGGAEESRVHAPRICGCIIGMPFDASLTNSDVYDANIQACTIGTLLRNPTGLHFLGAPLLQNDGLDLTITSATNASPIVLTVSDTSRIRNGMKGTVQWVSGNTAANGRWALSCSSPTQVALLGSTGNGVFTTGGTLSVGAGVLFQPQSGSTVNEVTIHGAWFENNSGYGIDFDIGEAGVGANQVSIYDCRFAGAATGDLGANAIHVQPASGTSAVNRLFLANNQANSLTWLVPTASVYGVSVNNTFASYVNSYPAGWINISHVDENQFPTLSVASYVQAASISPSSSNATPVASTGFVRLTGGNTNQIVFRNNAGTADVVAMSTDTSNDIIFGEVSQGTDVFLKGKNRVFLGHSTTANSFCVLTGGMQVGLPMYGGDGTNGVSGSPYGAVNGLVTVNYGDFDGTMSASHYSRHRIEFTDTWTNHRKRTFPTPNGTNYYYEKTIYNNTAGGFSVSASCGSGSVVVIANGKTAVVGFKSTNQGDAVRVTADV